MPFAADAATLAPHPHVLVAAVTNSWKTIVVHPGDTLWHLAIRHHTTPAAIVAKNRLKDGGRLIHPGQKLLVPGTASTPAPPTAPSTPTKPGASKPTTPAKPNPGTSGVYTVVAGDTMGAIAQRHGIRLSVLLAANPTVNASRIHIGQRIVVPGGSKPTAPKPGTTPTPGTPGYTYPDATKATVAQSRARLAAMSVPSRTETAALIRATALRHGVDPKLALAIGWQESGWNQRAVSYVNALGVMQVMPTSGIWASQLAGRKLDLYDVDDNITAGVLILRALNNSADSQEQAIAAYYQGLHSVRTRGMYTDTKAYVASILALRARM